MATAAVAVATSHRLMERHRLAARCRLKRRRLIGCSREAQDCSVSQLTDMASPATSPASPPMRAR